MLVHYIPSHENLLVRNEKELESNHSSSKLADLLQCFPIKGILMAAKYTSKSLFIILVQIRRQCARFQL